jgi:UDP-glucose 4-epimerase
VKYFVTGGAGFLGSNLVNALLDRELGEVRIYDNFASGRMIHFGDHTHNPRLSIISGDVGDLDRLSEAVKGYDVVLHLAANADIARAATEPLLDFENGTRLTQFVLEAMRQNGITRMVFTSGSGVYGDVPSEPIPEEWPRMVPISTYGASKLASEALISAYCHMFGIIGTVFRFANVVGPNMTHGVTHDFIRRLDTEPSRLLIYGDGQQQKPYIHTDDVVDAILLLLDRQRGGYEVFNVGSDDQLRVAEIAEVVVDVMGLSDVKFEYTGGRRGWLADVPVYRLNTGKIRSLGWANALNSREAVVSAARRLVEDFAKLARNPARAGK